MGIFSALKVDKRCTELEERLEKLERGMHALQMDWLDTLDKVKRMMQRVAKRAEVVEQAESATVDEVQTTLPFDNPGAPHAPLTARQQQIQNRILERRRRMGVAV